MFGAAAAVGESVDTRQRQRRTSRTSNSKQVLPSLQVPPWIVVVVHRTRTVKEENCVGGGGGAPKVL